MKHVTDGKPGELKIALGGKDVNFDAGVLDVAVAQPQMQMTPPTPTPTPSITTPIPTLTIQLPYNFLTKETTSKDKVLASRNVIVEALQKEKMLFEDVSLNEVIAGIERALEAEPASEAAEKAKTAASTSSSTSSTTSTSSTASGTPSGRRAKPLDPDTQRMIELRPRMKDIITDMWASSALLQGYPLVRDAIENKWGVRLPTLAREVYGTYRRRKGSPDALNELVRTHAPRLPEPQNPPVPTSSTTSDTASKDENNLNEKKSSSNEPPPTERAPERGPERVPERGEDTKIKPSSRGDDDIYRYVTAVSLDDGVWFADNERGLHRLHLPRRLLREPQHLFREPRCLLLPLLRP